MAGPYGVNVTLGSVPRLVNNFTGDLGKSHLFLFLHLITANFERANA